jgi:hypothetical protein
VPAITVDSVRGALTYARALPAGTGFHADVATPANPSLGVADDPPTSSFGGGLSFGELVAGKAAGSYWNRSALVSDAAAP